MNNDARPVLYIMDTLGLSGRTKGIIDLALHLDPRRYRPIFCSLGEETSALADRLHERNIPVEMLPLPDGLRPDGVWKLASLIRRYGIQVVHPVNPRPLLYAGLAARLTGVRSAVGSLSAFACQVPDREYRFLPQELVNRGRRQAIRNQLACGLMRYVVAVSDELGERFCRFTADAIGPLASFGYQALRRRMRTISYGIDLGPYRAVSAEEIAALRAQLGADPDTVLVGSVGRLVEQKDYPTQLSAFALAARVEPRLRMVLAGDGPLRGEIEALAAQLGITDRIVLLGHWTRVPALLRALDVFVLASKFEPYGVALLEAKCAGSAIVATAVNEIPKLLRDGVTGLVVPAEAPEPMAQAFLRMAREPGLRRSVADHAFAEAQEKHSIDAVAGAYQALYDTPS
ncbi:MAG TPA: glycosyltransferase [Kofleriaceae bacterium]|jgi:glycosyltransferase involved in cell wall biosynthesis|nr:glycosyltransferase [Kofleriaceae bacterium]